MNIVYLSHSDLFSKEANVVHVLSMCSAFINDGHKIKLFVWKNKKIKLKYENYKNLLKNFNINKNLEIFNYSSPFPLFNSLFLHFTLSNQIDHREIDFIIGRNLRACFSVSQKNYIFYETHKPFNYYNLFDRLIFKILVSRNKFLSLITISEYLIRDYKKISVFKNINILKLRDGSDSNDHIISYKDSQIPHVGYIGSLYEGRGIDIIIKLSNIMTNVLFNIVGGSEVEINKLKKNYNCSNIKFHGYLDHQSSLEQMKKFDILLAPYQSNTKVPEGINTYKWMSPIKLFEYMSAKKPIITSNIGALREFMMHKHNCILVKENNINEWREAIELILENKELSDRIAKNAYYDLKSNYTWDTRARNIIANFKKLKKS